MDDYTGLFVLVGVLSIVVAALVLLEPRVNRGRRPSKRRSWFVGFGGALCVFGAVILIAAWIDRSYGPFV